MQDGILGIWGPEDLELHLQENGIFGHVDCGAILRGTNHLLNGLI